MYKFDFHEATISYDYQRRLVELYFTKQSDYRSCIKRNPNYVLAEELNPGYRLLYPFNQVRTPEYILRTPQGAVTTTLKTSEDGNSEPSKAC